MIPFLFLPASACALTHSHPIAHSLGVLLLGFFLTLWQGKEVGNSLLLKPIFFLCLEGGCSSPPLLLHCTDHYLAKSFEQEEGRGFSAPLLKVVCLRAKSSLARGLRASKQIFLSNIWGGQRGRSPAPLVTLRLNALKKEKPTHKKSLRQGTELKIAPYSPDDRQQNGY